jgi:5-methylcytosine-specific restriction enzyme subunit McrC
VGAATIPIANIYYLLLYAWDKLDEAGVADVTTEEHHELVDLLAKVLIGGTNDILRRGIDRGYVTHEETIPAIRGRLLLTATLQRNLLETARTHCAFDEFSADILHNQILKATLRILAGVEQLDRDLREQAGDLERRFGQISDIRLTGSHFRRVQLHRNNAHYDLLLKISGFLFDNILVDERTGHSRFRDFDRDMHKMRLLFEAFARNFFIRHFPELKVSNPVIDWFGIDRADASSSTLPKMKTDIVIRSETQVLIIDTKFTPKAFASRFESDKAKSQSDHLYQVFAYLRNYGLHHPGVTVSGMLLYPVIEERFNHRYELHEHPIEIASIDLRSEWHGIEREMMNLVRSKFAACYTSEYSLMQH